MSHAEFVLGYENGRLGCSVSVFMTLRLFFAGRIPGKKSLGQSPSLVTWLPGANCCVHHRIGQFTCTLGFAWRHRNSNNLYPRVFYFVGELVLSAALANQEFYEFAKAKGALRIYSDDEENLPKV
jgi:hypothetical protein